MLAVGGVGLGLRPTVMVPVEGTLKHLNPRQYAIFTAMVDAFVSPTSDMPDVQSLNVGQTIDGMLDSLHPDDVTQLLQAVGLIENALAGFVFEGRIQTFSASSRETRVQILNGWRTSRLSLKQQAYLALHQVCVASYWGHPKAYSFAGYMGPPNFDGLAPAGGQDG